MNRIFFIGAGMSAAAGLPLTRDLWRAVAHSITRTPETYHHLRDYLRSAHGIADEHISRAALEWGRRFGNARPSTAAEPDDDASAAPDLLEVFSTLDVLLDENSMLGLAQGVRPFSSREMPALRDSLVRTLSEAFRSFSDSHPLYLRLAAILHPADTIITTNWDMLLDRALHESSAGLVAAQLGTDATIVARDGTETLNAPARFPPGPRLLKLHGSFTWLYCQCCTRLYVNPQVPIAALARSGASPTSANGCDCGALLSPLLVAPTYLKDYHNRHLANVWHAALDSLARSDTWFFIGYSLPADDMHIRVLFKKALQARLATGLSNPQVWVSNLTTAAVKPYGPLFGSRVAFAGPADHFLAMLEAQALR